MSNSTRFLILGNYPHHGMFGVSAQRIKRVSELVRQLGGNVCDAYALLGKYDIVLIVDLPSNDEALQLAARLKTSLGLTTETLPAIAVERFDQIAENLQTEIESARMEAGE